VLVYERNRQDVYCVIIGSGDSLDDLKKMSRDLKLDTFVWFTGFVPDSEVLQILSSADICVDPDPASPLNDVSTWIKIMEYMAMGKPIVSFALKETQFSAQDAAIFVPPNDVAKFAAGIEKLMDDPAGREEMGARGRRRVERDLQWPVVGQELLRAYEFLFGR
jgi:glycosyltransferase involved in cell wall biosynthesis